MVGKKKMQNSPSKKKKQITKSTASTKETSKYSRRNRGSVDTNPSRPIRHKEKMLTWKKFMSGKKLHIFWKKGGSFEAQYAVVPYNSRSGLNWNKAVIYEKNPVASGAINAPF